MDPNRTHKLSRRRARLRKRHDSIRSTRHGLVSKKRSYDTNALHYVACTLYRVSGGLITNELTLMKLYKLNF